MAKKLICEPNECDKYDERIDSSTMTEFTHGAFRLFHEHIPEHFDFLNADYKLIRRFNLSQIYSNSKLLEGNYENVMRGLLNLKIRSRLLSYTAQVT